MAAEITPESLVLDAQDLVSLPDIFLQVNSMLDDPRYVAADLAEVISKEPVLSARILKLANSSLYGLNGRVDTLTRAMTFIGLNEVRDMLVTSAVVDTFNRIPQSLVDMADFWIRSVQCGVLCKLIAKECSVLHAERLFMTGLLHDLGSMVMYCKQPALSRQVLVAAGDDRNRIPEIETSIFGFSSADVGCALLASWQLPEAICQAVGGQLDPLSAPDAYRLECHILNLARLLCMVSVDGGDLQSVLATVSCDTFQLLAIDQAAVGNVLARLPDDFTEIFSIVVPSARMVY